MSIVLACRCGKKLKVPGDAAGKKTHCPACQTLLMIPSAAKPGQSLLPPPVENKPNTLPEKLPVEKRKAAEESPAPLELDDEPQEKPRPKRPRRPSSEEIPASASSDSDQGNRPQKKRSLLRRLAILGCGGFLFLTLMGGGVVGYLLYTSHQREAQVVGVWEREDLEKDPAEAIRKFPFTRLELESQDHRFVGKILLGASISGKFHIVRSPGDGLIGMNVDVEEKIGPDGKAMPVSQGKEEVMGFHIRVVDADHLEWSPAGTSAWVKFRRATGDSPKPGAGGTEPADPKPVATITPDVLWKDREKYGGQWIVAIARLPRVYKKQLPDGRVEATVDLLGEDGKADMSGDFDATEWAKVPKLEDGLRYEVLGLFENQGNLGGKLKKCRFLGVSKVEGTQPEARMSVQDLIKDGAKYKEKLIAVKGKVGTAAKTGDNASVTLKAPGTDKFMICVMSSKQFEMVQKAGRGAEVEIKGIVTSTNNVVTMNDCSVVSSQPLIQLKLADFAANFADNATKAATYFKSNSVSITGKVESVSEGKIVFLVPKNSRPKNAEGYTVVAGFGPDWNESVSKVKPGDTIAITGDYLSFQNREIVLEDCWLVPK